MFKKFLFIILIILPLSTPAHSPIANLIPSDGAVLKDTPKEIQIEFVNPAMFTKFEIINTENNNEKVDLPKEFLMVLSDKHTIKLPELSSGKYINNWRAMARRSQMVSPRRSEEGRSRTYANGETMEATVISVCIYDCDHTLQGTRIVKSEKVY